MNEFSKKTGDYASLSLADIKVLALTYELEVEVQGSDSHLNTEPRKIVTEGATTKASRNQKFNDPPEQVTRRLTLFGVVCQSWNIFRNTDVVKEWEIYLQGSL